MVRPKVPLISKRNALELALDIIDTEGIDALSIRRLADRLNVNGASLYHHFDSKEDILFGAAELALEGVREPELNGDPWRVWMLRSTRRLRRAFFEHPDLVPVMLRYEPLALGTAELERTATRLQDEGVPIGAIAPLLEALELLAASSALHESRAPSPTSRQALRTEGTPQLERALDNRGISADEIFDKVSGQVMDTLVALAAERAASATKKANGARRRTPRAPGGRALQSTRSTG